MFPLPFRKDSSELMVAAVDSAARERGPLSDTTHTPAPVPSGRQTPAGPRVSCGVPYSATRSVYGATEVKLQACTMAKACAAGDIEQAKALLARGFAISTFLGTGGLTALTAAVESNQEALVLFLSHVKGARLHEAFLFAVQHGHVSCAKLLAARPEVDVNQAHMRTGRTALMDAATRGHLGILEWLVPLPSIDSARFGQSAFMCAVQEGHLPCVKFLAAQPEVAVGRSTCAVAATPCLWLP